MPRFTIASVDDLRFGAVIRSARIRRNWRQHDVAAAASVSDATVSRLERGHIGGIGLVTVRRIASVLDMRVELLPRSRGADADRLLNARHAALAEAAVRLLGSAPGWVVRPEVSFSEFGERGIVDILGWHAASRSLLVVELKTELVDIGELLGTLDRKRRLGTAIARPFGWQPAAISAWLVIAESMTNRRRVAEHRATLDAALGGDGRTLRRYLRDPAGLAVAGLSFFPDRRPGNVRSGFAMRRRVRTRR